MKLFVLLAVVACSNAAKLDRAYLPPNHAVTSGGSGNFLQTPVNDYQGNGFNNGAAGNNGQANNYQNNGDFGQNGNNFAQTGNGFAQNNEYGQNTNGFNNFGNSEGRPERPRAALDKSAAILRLDNENDGESYAYAYETENGIVSEENGVATDGVEAQGGYSYTGDDGQVYSVRYTAGANGFVPEGDHLPTPPPIPEEILKALEQNARDEAAGIYDDGSYSEGKYGSANDNYNNENNYNGGNNFNSNNYNGNNVGNTYNEARIGDDEDSVVTTNALFRSGTRSAARNQATGSNQGLRNQGTVDSAYLPPFEKSQPTIQAGSNGFNQAGNNGNQGLNQAGNYNQAARSQSSQRQNGVEKAYLPPFGRNGQNQGQGPASNGQNPSFSSQEPTNGVTNAYIPPNNQRSQGFARRQPSFNARNGYQY